MRLTRLIKYVGIATVAAGIGFVAGGGDVPFDLDAAPEQLAARAREAADELEKLNQQAAPVTDALNSLREKFVTGARRLAGFIAD